MQTKRKNRNETPKVCFFCKEKTNPDFLKFDILSRFITERGKIMSRSRSGVCAQHQRKLTKEIKRARHLAFLPFIVSAE